MWTMLCTRVDMALYLSERAATAEKLQAVVVAAVALLLGLCMWVCGLTHMRMMNRRRNSSNAREDGKKVQEIDRR